MNNVQQTPKPSLGVRIMKAIDIFSFQPVPKTDPVSSHRSMVGSVILFSLFAFYIIFNFITFITNNTPAVNQYSQQYSFFEQNTTLPDIAFGFLLGEPFDESINDEHVLWMVMSQNYKYSNVSQSAVSKVIPIGKCSPSWIDQVSIPLYCPNVTTNMSGTLYESAVFSYPRIMVYICMKNSSSRNCTTPLNLAQTLAGGRIFLYIRNLLPNVDMTNGKSSLDINYTSYQFYLMENFYQKLFFMTNKFNNQIYRTIVTFQGTTYQVNPDYFTRFSTQTNNYLSVDNVDSYISNVTVYNVYNALQIYFQVYSQETVIELVYNTIFDEISLWGAFWGVLFSTFAAYFLTYNSNHFYNNNQNWNNFESQVATKQVDVVSLLPTQQNIEMTDIDPKTGEKKNFDW